MANGGESSKGWSLWWDGVAATSTAVAGVTGFNLPGNKSLMVDVTGLESEVVEDFFHVGLKVLGELKVEVNSKSTSAQHIAIMNDAGSGTLREFIVKNGAGTPDPIATFDAYVIDHDLKVSAKDAIRGTFTVKVAEAITNVVSS